MAAVEKLVTDHLDLWTAAIKRKSAAGRGSSKKEELYGLKRLRELILELAVRGLLVQQDPKDEPASELLKKMAAEKARLIKEKKIRNSRPLLAISDEEKFMLLPTGWVFTRLNDVGDWGAGATPSRNNLELYGGSIPWFKSGELVADYISQSEESVTELALEKASLRYNKVGDVLIAMYGATIGKTAILSIPATTNQAVCACTPFSGFENTYLLTLLKAFKPRFIGMGAGGAQPNISREKIIETVVAVPPNAEQHRIVAKVGELMALCDQLEQQTYASLSAHQTLVKTLLNALTSTSDHTQFVSSWQRIAEHFDMLFTSEASIDQLKQTILKLAVMGKLVPQDPKDEPASQLLEKIAAEKAKLAKEGKIKKEKSQSPVEAADMFHELPQGWAWARLGWCGLSSTGKTPSTNELKYYGGNIPFIGPGQISIDGELSAPEKFLSEAGLKESTEAQPNDILMVCIGGSIGKAAIANKQLAFNQQINAIRPIQLSSKYLYIAVSSKYFIDEVLSQATGSATPIINRSKWEELLVPICPIEEQIRIAAKVDELMVLCDQLQSCLAEVELTQLHLADALTEKALARAC